MVFAALGALLTAEGGTPIPFFTRRFLALCCEMGPYAHAAWAAHRGLRKKYETVGCLHRFRRNRPSNRLRRWPDCRDVVAGNKPAGVPRRLFLRAVGRLAARREGGLSSSSN